MRDLKWNGIAYAVMAGIGVLVLVGMWLFVPMLRRRWLPLPRLRPGSWSGFDVVLTWCVMFGFPLIIIAVLLKLRFFVPLLGTEPEFEPPTPALKLYLERCQIISSPLILAVTLGMVLALHFARSRTRPHQYGVSWARWPANLALGLAAFIVATPVVLGLYTVFTVIVPERPHQLTELGKQNLDEWEWILLGFQAIVAAPLVEEIVFRGILQGWLRRASLRGHVTVGVMTIFFAAMWYTPSAQPWAILEYLPPMLFAGSLVAVYGFLLLRMARRFKLTETERFEWQLQPVASAPETSESILKEQVAQTLLQVRQQADERRRQWADANADLAILGSAMFFAVAHMQAWPGPLALILLAVVFGWMARRTQSLIGPITAHALFNLVAFLALYGSVREAPPQNGNASTTAVRPSLVGSTTSSVPGSQLPLRK